MIAWFALCIILIAKPIYAAPTSEELTTKETNEEATTTVQQLLHKTDSSEEHLNKTEIRVRREGHREIVPETLKDEIDKDENKRLLTKKERE